MANKAAKKFAAESNGCIKPVIMPHCGPEELTLPHVSPVTNAVIDNIPCESKALNISDIKATFDKANSDDKWQYAIHKCVKAVVSIHFSNILPFDTERTYCSEATGFVVDSERGIIMTNRHVVGPGPFRGYVIFDNHEECAVTAMYRDPVHDFGFIKYNPSQIKHMRIQQLTLNPENARVGVEIRVIGNDAGEKLSILAGVISRIDRNTPDYGDMGYNDFNTEYIQAAASATGGSSGSPVVDISGDVVALQAGGSTVASTDFFLPLFRGRRALQCLQTNQEITRGTIQVKWLLQPYDECRRLGLTEEAEVEARKNFPESIGMLVAMTTIPEGPACGLIEEGDCLVAINSKPVASFRDLDDILDSNVGETLEISIMRNGNVLKPRVTVQNLFDITPDRFVRVAGAVFHELSYQIASYYARPVRGVYVAYSGMYFNPTPNSEETTGWVLQELDDKETIDLDTFIEVIKKIPNGKSVSAKFWHVADPHAIISSIINVNRQWANGPQDFELAQCNNKTGVWDFTNLDMGAESEQPRPQKARFLPMNHVECSPEIASLNNSIIEVKMLRPAVLDGFSLSSSQMHGFVIDAEQGLVLVSRMCVPHYLVDLKICVAESVNLDARVVFLHPTQGYAIIQYDPKLIDADIKSIVLEDSNSADYEELNQGTPLKFISRDKTGSTFVIDTKVMDIAPTPITVGYSVAPQYRSTNIDCVGIDSSMATNFNSGLLADPVTGHVRAIWLSHLADSSNSNRQNRVYKFAIDAATLKSTVDLVKSNLTKTDPRFIDLEAKSINFATARVRKVPESWLKRFEIEKKPGQLRLELLSVIRVSSSLQSQIEEGDVILAIDDVLATSVSQLTNLPETAEQVKLTIVRRGQVMDITLNTTRFSETITRTLVSWCGMAVQAPHHSVLQQVKKLPSQVYIVSTHGGSPAAMYGIYATSFVTHVNGEPTPDIEAFFRVVKTIKDDTYVKIRVVYFEGIPAAQSIKTNYHYFPTWRIDLDPTELVWKHAN